MKLLTIFLLLTATLFGSETKDLERTVRVWKNKLSMADWTIVIKPVPKIILANFICEDSECFAASNWSVRSKTGVIFVMMREDYTKEMKKEMKYKNIKSDQRNSVVHEMLHNIWKNMDEEYAMWVLSKALKP